MSAIVSLFVECGQQLNNWSGSLRLLWNFANDWPESSHQIYTSINYLVSRINNIVELQYLLITIIEILLQTTNKRLNLLM